MVVAVTEGVKISVFSLFEERMSAAPQGSFVFSYRISIENQNDYPIQLLRRHWFITDSNGLKREIEGPGVVGEQLPTRVVAAFILTPLRQRRRQRLHREAPAA